MIIGNDVVRNAPLLQLGGNRTVAHSKMNDTIDYPGGRRRCSV